MTGLSPARCTTAWSGATTPGDYVAFARRATADAHGPMLDVAGGTAVFTADAYSGSTRRIVVSDLSLGMLGRAARRLAGAANVALVQADAEDPPFATAAFDTVACMGSLHVFSNVTTIVAAMRPLVAPGGTMVLSGLVAARRLGSAYLRQLLGRPPPGRPRRHPGVRHPRRRLRFRPHHRRPRRRHAEHVRPGGGPGRSPRRRLRPGRGDHGHRPHPRHTGLTAERSARLVDRSRERRQLPSLQGRGQRAALRPGGRDGAARRRRFGAGQAASRLLRRRSGTERARRAVVGCLLRARGSSDDGAR